MKQNHRYNSKPYSKRWYHNEFTVVCPKCSKDAIVKPNSRWSMGNGYLNCPNCYYSCHSQDNIIYNLELNRYCFNCGKEIKMQERWTKTKTKNMKVTCPHCQVVANYQPRNVAYILKAETNELAADPLFNLPLWYQCNVKGNSFWAYNRQHLADIKEYVNSQLRERQTPYFSTMVERLPTFIKLAKNRIAILKGIDNMEKKYKSKR